MDDNIFADTSLRDAGVLGPSLHRIIGPPGCGKTTYLKNQVEKAAAKFGSGGVVVASLTRAAAVEVADRVRTIPRENIGTLHSHAYHALKRPAIVETSAGLREWNEFVPTSSWRISNKHAVDPENASPEPTVMEDEGAQLLSLMNINRSRMTPREVWLPKVARFAKLWEEFKAEKSYLDFTDLIERALDDIDKHPVDPAVMMIDEAQDMSVLEMELIKKWGSHTMHLVIVGDPDQNLYQWRGSDPVAFWGADAEFEHVLAQSYRVPKAVHAMAVQWMDQCPGRQPVEYHPRRETPTDPDSEPVPGECRRIGAYWRDPGTLIRPILEDLDHHVEETQWVDDHYEVVSRPATVMVLASCGYMLAPLLSELRRKGIPFHNPYRVTHGGWNPMRGARRVLAFKRPDNAVWGAEARLWTWGEVWAWAEPLQAKNVMTRGAKAFIESQLAEDRFGDGAKDEIVSLDTLQRLFTDEAMDAVFTQDLSWWGNHLLHSQRSPQQFPLEVARRHGAARLLEHPRLIVGTIHSVKGGESDYVYLAPDMSSAAFFEGWRKGGERRAAVYRQFYVAMTRARHGLRLIKASGTEAVRWPLATSPAATADPTTP